MLHGSSTGGMPAIVLTARTVDAVDGAVVTAGCAFAFPSPRVGASLKEEHPIRSPRWGTARCTTTSSLAGRRSRARTEARGSARTHWRAVRHGGCYFTGLG